MENDPLYRQGLHHFGRGEWAEALACFTQLQVNYPDDPRVAQFLETARLRAAMSTGLRRGARFETRSIWLRRLSWLGVVVVIGLIGLAVYAAYQTWAVPAQAESARQTRIAQLRQTGQVQIASGQYADAGLTFQRILTEAPDDPEATAGLARAQKLEQVAGLYAQATQARGAGNQAEAKRLLEQINSI
ncbi:MAG TPA: tetratricopeptide repeat protein, partial [Anaerolineae bacterium]|nr:tetratricopeptide repeat protein [Anaerolineae bacterium]